MRSFFKSYIIVSILLEMLSIGIELNTRTNGLMGALLQLGMMKKDIAMDLGGDLVLMMVVALPFFLLVQKYSNFSWIHGCVMWSLVLFCRMLIVGFSFDDLTFTFLQFMLLVNIIIGNIFMSFYKFFQNKEKPFKRKIDEVF